MKLTFQQIELYKAYDQAIKDDGARGPEGWMDLDTLPVPPGWTEDWRDNLEQEKPKLESVEMNDAMRSFLEKKSVAPQPVSKPVFPEVIPEVSPEVFPDVFAEYGRLGGKKRAEKLSKERRSEIARMGGLAKGKK